MIMKRPDESAEPVAAEGPAFYVKQFKIARGESKKQKGNI
jgi:hypothetical protein